MKKIIGSIPDKVYLGFSGGSDSLFALHFLTRARLREVIPFIIDHGTNNVEDAQEVLWQFNKESAQPFKSYEPIISSFPSDEKKEDYESLEMYWRRIRYDYGFHTLDGPVITAHHLNDCAENYLITTVRTGEGKVIPYRNKNVIRPFLNWSKADITNYNRRHGLDYHYEDPTNYDCDFFRSRVRHNILPEVMQCHPGFLKVVSRKVDQHV